MTMRFTKDHEWVRRDGDHARVGISEYAQEQLGDIVFVELPKVGKHLKKGDEAAVVESVKAASEIYAPAGGEVTEVNQILAEEPATINADAIGEGWMFALRLSDPAELDGLMDEAEYGEYVAGLE